MSTFHVAQEGPVNALALNRDYTQVAIGGRNVFKVYAIEEDKFREICNVRGSKHLNVGFSCNDVSWSPTDDHYLATAATNGHVSVWNLTKMGKAMQEQDYQDHKRTVNKVNFHASEPNKLISGSQDGTMRYFDIRVKSAVSIFYSNTESVRDVQFSPHSPYTFSAVSDNGSVQLWDIRKPEKCQQQYTAHSGPVFACDWHPEVTWLATASRDRTIKVWDLTSKPTLEYTIHTIASIGHVKWRPQRKYHIASCALVIDCSINVWDVRRPYIPFAAFNEHRESASGVQFRGDPDIFLSSGRDSTLYHHSFNDAARPAAKANPQGLAINNSGEIIFARKLNQFPTTAVTPVTGLTTPTSLAKVTVGLMRKISTTQAIDQFHHAASMLQHFFHVKEMVNYESQNILALAKNYVLHGRSISELCEHNSAVAREFGKPHISVIWKIIKTMYGEEFMQNSINSGSSNREDVPHSNMNNLSSTVMQMDTSINTINTIRDLEAEQKSKAASDTQAAQFSGGDDETENEDQVDHMGTYNGFPTYLNIRSGLPKGDFSFGENELDMELDSLTSDFHSGYRGYNHVTSDGPEWILPNEAFTIRHEIQDRSPPPEQFPNHHHSPDIHEDTHTHFQYEETSPTLISVSKIPKKSLWDPSSLVVEALRHHAILGDIQTAACILIVLGDCRKFLRQLDEATQEHWLMGYIEILSSYKLWNIVTQVIKLSWLPSVYQLNQQSTRINTNCGKCSKSLQRVGWLCDRCHSSEYALCSICNQVVKGLYVWCQGCSHGGHLAHMRQWTLSNKVCPSGCGHLCEYG
ncbi:GATOR complex protein WDR24 isoform X2 [Diabrotica virgifera virgifera]|uniref:GATOR2 complex protein WDR24 n=1 Tax=Diabrotica virgifera virgifera TaxID=50390 RepID=A0ABM5JZC7_DIAVI|nr:GATOR complex protein WDR24 isoform X2 [Diabrotica virgifera virgifera]